MPPSESGIWFVVPPRDEPLINRKAHGASGRRCSLRLEVTGTRIRYQNLWFDTPSLVSFFPHRRLYGPDPTGGEGQYISTLATGGTGDLLKRFILHWR